MRRVRMPLLTGLAAGSLTVLVTLPAHAGVGDDQVGGDAGDGQLTAVAVSLSGNGLGGGDGSDGGGGGVSVSVQVPSPCYWDVHENITGEWAYENWALNYDDLDDPVGPGYDQTFVYPPLEEIEAHRDEPGAWAFGTLLNVDGGFDAASACFDQLVAANGGAHTIWVAEGTTPPQPPPPPVPPEMLAEVAYEHLDIPAPDTARSPVADSYVNLPTWFWVAPGDGPRDGFVRLEVTATAGENSATVVADPDRLSVRSSGGPSVGCSAEQARTSYASGTPESAGCSLTHPRSSARAPGLAYTVTATGAYVASWSGQEGGTPVPGGGLGTVVSPATSVDLPVAEVQTVVIR
ncbi:hypothetical protein [Jiangella mangrovi]|uniref:Uncharacterized protein n=1 Tax=Jiangella mangrovi TaxID=1524084 RepID=A0A7W9LK36_9ACTN|nr:hypothetical protein [Jiangella mangrovi]MBB5786688.1 hypothetical protein [Jiangella mangrovi]